MTFEKKARPTGKKQLRQNDTARAELKRCTRVFEILGAFKILRQHGSWSSAWVFKIWVRFVIGTTVMRAFIKESHGYTRFQRNYITDLPNTSGNATCHHAMPARFQKWQT